MRLEKILKFLARCKLPLEIMTVIALFGKLNKQADSLRKYFESTSEGVGSNENLQF